MPKQVNFDDLKISKKPTIEVITRTHKAKCAFPKTKKKQDCRCPKYFYITAGEGERYRVASGYTSWKDAEDEKQRLLNSLSPEARAERGKKTMSRVTIEEAFNLYIQAKAAAQDPGKLAEYGPNPAIVKFRTLKTEIVKFLAEWNAQPRAEKKIAPDKTVERIEYFDELTTFWLETAWRPTWFGGNGSYWSKLKRRDLVIEIGHWAQKNGYIADTRTRVSNRCECVFCNMSQLKQSTDNVQPTPPFQLPQYDQIVDTCVLFEASFRDANASQLRISNQRLRALIEVMRWCGPRISDASLMCKEDVHFDRAQERYVWTYFPIKNKKKKAVMVPVPEHVMKQLEALPLESGFDPRYYFWSGNSTKRNAADPWQRALTRLWTLCPVEAQVYDARNKKKLNPTSHMFRNTFCVQCRVHGMSYSQIADAIGDTEAVVRDHYSAYCEDYDRMVLNQVSRMQQAGMQQASIQ